MKTFIALLTLIAIFEVCCKAQTDKETIVFSSSTDLSFSSIKNTAEFDNEEIWKQTTTQFNIIQKSSYFIIDNLSIGVQFEYQFEEDDDYKANTYLLGPTARYFFGKTKIKPYTKAGLVMGKEKEEYDGITNYNMLGWDLGIGVALFINDKISIDLGVTYSSLTQKNEDEHRFTINNRGLGFDIGFSLFF